ncbi:MAG: tetratricopeptide repeat protein [Candidatus Zixiibacteriota bacterium]
MTMTAVEEGELLFNEGRFDEARERFLEAAQSEPTSVEALNNLGVIAFQQKQPGQAAQYFARALEIDPFHVETILNYCALLKSLGRLHKGLAILKHATAVCPDNQDIARVLNDARQAARLLPAPGPAEGVADTIAHKKRFAGTKEAVQPESHCGAGSYLANTVEIRQFLASAIRKYNIQSMIDVACGDWNWMRLVDLQGVTYTGYDLDEGFIAENRKRFPQHRFIVADVLRTVWPQVDLILCRDLMIHLADEDNLTLLESFRRSGSTWLMATTYDKLEKNRDFTDAEKRTGYSRTGRPSRVLNLEIDPYNLPRPVEFVRENHEVCQDRIVGLWETG